jgi:hypothetical protein
LTENQEKIGLRRYALASRDLIEADRHRRLLDARLLADTPSEIDGVKLSATLFA